MPIYKDKKRHHDVLKIITGPQLTWEARHGDGSQLTLAAPRPLAHQGVEVS